jgi:hypothetical protein
MPEALKLIYKHMKYGPLEDAVFSHMTGWYDTFLLSYPPEYERFFSRPRCDDVVDRTSINILMTRDVPRAVTYMLQEANGLVPIEELTFRHLIELAEGYLSFTNDFDIWRDEKVTAFWEFSSPVIEWLYYENGIDPIDLAAFKDMAKAVTGHVSYKPPPYFPRSLDLPAELREAVYD